MTTYEKVMGIIAEPMGWIMSFIYDFIGNYGLTLIIFTIIIRCCLLPLYAAQIKSSIKMAEVQPKMQEIQKRYANDREMMNIKMQELYKQEKFNPAGGCLPMLVQMPIIFALFVLLRNPLAYIDKQSMLMAVHESFFWIPDMSQPDSWILPLLAGFTTFFSMFITQQINSAQSAGQMKGMMKAMQYFMPIMIVWMARSFPSGLALYWFVGNVFTILQTLYLKKYRMKVEKKSKNGKKKVRAAAA